MRNKLPTILMLLLAVMGLSGFPAQAASGIPGSNALAYAGRLDPAAPQVDLALNAAASLGLDWVILEVDWSALPRSLEGQYDLSTLARRAERMRSLGLYGALSITHAPQWAMRPDGPDPQAAADLVRQLVQLAPRTLLAVELFPAPNTRAGWGAPPNAAAYAALLRRVSAELQSAGLPAAPVVGGLAMFTAPDSPADIPDTAFLQALYDAHAAADMPIVGLAYPVLDPASDAPLDPQGTLRHYQDLRMIMLRNGHADGVLWVMQLAWKTGVSGEVQQRWLEQTYGLLRHQLYIGLVSFNGLTPSPRRPVAVVSEQGGLTPLFNLLGEVLGEYRSPHLADAAPPRLKTLSRKPWHKIR